MANAAYLVLVARANAAARGAKHLLPVLFAQPLLFHVIWEDEVRVIADQEVVAHGDAGSPKLADLFEEADRIDDHAVAYHGAEMGPKHSRG